MPRAAASSEPVPPAQPSANGLSSLADRLLALADRPAGVVILVLLALLEATVFPGPTEAMLIALTLGCRRKAWRFAALATVASVAGGFIGYQMGALWFDEVVRPLLATYGLSGSVNAVMRVYRDNLTLALVTSGYTPIPYMLYTTIAGASYLPLLPFLVGSLAGRALKYVPIAALAYMFGPAVHRIIRRFGWVALAVLALLGVALYIARR